MIRGPDHFQHLGSIKCLTVHGFYLQVIHTHDIIVERVHYCVNVFQFQTICISEKKNPVISLLRLKLVPV